MRTEYGYSVRISFAVIEYFHLEISDNMITRKLFKDIIL
jgi:hypothetical protein